MKAVFRLRETNMKSAKEKIPAYFEGEIQGNGIFTITLNDGKKYILDAKNTLFTSDKLLIEGHIADEQEFLGRQLEKNVAPDECIVALDHFMSNIIEHQVAHSTQPQYLFFPKSKLLDFLSSKMRHIQTNNHIFLVISE